HFDRDIEFRHVWFRYPNQEDWVLKDINFVLPKGQMFALVGSSGAGKTTIADLIARFYDVTQGEILIDGIDIRNIPITDLRNLISMVSQDPVLFNDSIFNNISFGWKDSNSINITEAAKIANAWEFIQILPQGLQSNIGDRGSKLSGGQRQRLTIARAVLRNPAILILDEATSALDTVSEKLVQEALDRVLQNRSSLVIAHRLTTVQAADKILVLDQGQIVESGTHESLIEHNGLYRHLVSLQTK
ncbi:MAG: ATP-binding cassette domain-containing protein, partial [Saprospiraceae bacterium]